MKNKDNQRAGLWSVCNKSVKIDNNNFDKYIEINNETDTQQLISTTKINKARDLFANLNEYEDCYSKFILKEGIKIR